MCCLRLPSISDIHSQKFAKIHSTEYSDVTNKTISTFNNLARELQPMLFLSNGWNGKIDESEDVELIRTLQLKIQYGFINNDIDIREINSAYYSTHISFYLYKRSIKYYSKPSMFKCFPLIKNITVYEVPNIYLKNSRENIIEFRKEFSKYKDQILDLSSTDFDIINKLKIKFKLILENIIYHEINMDDIIAKIQICYNEQKDEKK